MTKGKNGSALLSWAVAIFASLCGASAFFLIFAPAVLYEPPLWGRETYSGLQVAFGYAASGIRVFRGSAGVALAFIFPLAAASCAVIGKGNKIVAIVSAALFVAGGVLAFCLPNLLVGAYVGTPALGVGGALCGVLSVAGGVTECASLLLKE